MIATHKKYAKTLQQLPKRDLNAILEAVENARRLEAAIETWEIEGLAALDELYDSMAENYSNYSNYAYVKRCRIVLENAAAAAAQLEAELLRQNIGVPYNPGI